MMFLLPPQDTKTPRKSKKIETQSTPRYAKEYIEIQKLHRKILRIFAVFTFQIFYNITNVFFSETLASWRLGGSKTAYLVLFTLGLSFSPNTAQAADKKFLDIQEITSQSGITAWLVEDHALPIIAMKFAFKGEGALNDPIDKQGLTRMLSNTLDEGAGPYSSQDFQKALTDHSISLHFGASRDDFTGSLKTLTRHKDLAFTLLQTALNEPRFDEEPIARMKEANLARVRSSLSNPDWIAARIMNDIAFEGHPYALNSGGTLTSLQNITTEDLKRAAQQRLHKGALVISVVGDITAEDLALILEQVFAPLPFIESDRINLSATIQNGGTTTLYEKDIPQTLIEIMQTGIGRDDPDYYPAMVMDFILGGSGFGSRLTEEIREKRGLTYGIHSRFYAMDHLKAYTISTSTKNETAAEMLGLITVELEKMRTTSVTPKELSAAQSYLIGSMPLSLSSTDRIAGLIQSLQRDNLPLTYLDQRAASISAVTAQDILHVAQRLLTPDKLTTILVGQPENITPTKTIETLPNVE